VGIGLFLIMAVQGHVLQIKSHGQIGENFVILILCALNVAFLISVPLPVSILILVMEVGISVWIVHNLDPDRDAKSAFSSQVGLSVQHPDIASAFDLLTIKCRQQIHSGSELKRWLHNARVQKNKEGMYL